MTSHSKNEAMNAITFNMMTEHFVEFVQSFAKKTANLATNTIEHVSEMELYIILSTLEKLKIKMCESALITNYQWMK